MADAARNGAPRDLIPRARIAEANGEYGRFDVFPIEPGHSASIGNPLRRALLNGLEGWAVASARIDGALREFDVIEGVRDRVLDILLNLKRTRFRALDPSLESGTARLEVSGGALSGMIDCGGLFDAANPDNSIMSLSGPNSSLSMEMTVERGMGYRLADREGAGPGFCLWIRLSAPRSGSTAALRSPRRTETERTWSGSWSRYGRTAP